MMRGWRRRFGIGCRRGAHSGQSALSRCRTGQTVSVVHADAVRAIEMGLHAGVSVHVLRNARQDAAMMVEIGDMRLSLPRDLADQVQVVPLEARACQHAGTRHGLLRDIRHYVQEAGRVDARTISWHFDMDEAAVEGMLSFLEKRGQVQRHRLDCGSGCGSCKGCDMHPPSAPKDMWSVVPRTT